MSILYCVEVSCEEVREECGYQTVKEVEVVPVETCVLQYREDQLCANTEPSLSQCDLVVSRVCRRGHTSTSSSTSARQRRRRKKRRRMKKPDRAKP